MLRTFILGAAAAAAIGLTAAPAQAHMANPALGAGASGNVENAQYYYGGGYGWRRHHGWRRGYAYYPRRCWTERIRTWNGHIRYVRRCR